MSVFDSVLKSLIKINVARRISVPVTEIEAVVRSMMMSVSISWSVKPIVGDDSALQAQVLDIP